jgi:hypothetical protein
MVTCLLAFPHQNVWYLGAPLVGSLSFLSLGLIWFVAYSRQAPRDYWNYLNWLAAELGVKSETLI